jgi:hypothetical protein
MLRVRMENISGICVLERFTRRSRRFLLRLEERVFIFASETNQARCDGALSGLTFSRILDNDGGCQSSSALKL